MSAWFRNDGDADHEKKIVARLYDSDFHVDNGPQNAFEFWQAGWHHGYAGLNYLMAALSHEDIFSEFVWYTPPNTVPKDTWVYGSVTYDGTTGW